MTSFCWPVFVFNVLVVRLTECDQKLFQLIGFLEPGFNWRKQFGNCIWHFNRRYFNLHSQFTMTDGLRDWTHENIQTLELVLRSIIETRGREISIKREREREEKGEKERNTDGINVINQRMKWHQATELGSNFRLNSRIPSYILKRCGNSLPLAARWKV